MAFDVDAYRAARRPWEYTFRGRTWRARHVSAPDCERYEDMRRSAKRERQKKMAVWWILRRAFPWRPTYWLTGDPVRILLGLEPAERNEALKDFFARLGGTSPTPLQRVNPRTNGTSSPGPTLHQSA